jgi:hypothetical protein
MTLVEILGDPCHWGTAWNGLRHLSIAHSITHDLPTLDFYFLSEYLQLKTGNSVSTSHVFYLDRKNVALLEAGGTPSTTFPAVQNIAHPPMIFLMVEHRECFELPLFMLLNLRTHEALLVTVGGNQEQEITERDWFKAIWSGVVEVFGCRNSHPTLVYGNWIKVCLCFPAKSKNKPFMLDRNPRTLDFVSFLSSILFSLRSGNGKRMAAEKSSRHHLCAALKFLITFFSQHSRDARDTATTGSNSTNTTKHGVR